MNEEGFVRGKFFLPYNPGGVEKARELRKGMTPAERKLWYEFLRHQRPRFLRQRPIDNFVADFYCAKLKLVIELDGNRHFTEKGKAYDDWRTSILSKYGITVTRFENIEVLMNFSPVCQSILTIMSDRHLSLQMDPVPPNPD